MPPFYVKLEVEATIRRPPPTFLSGTMASRLDYPSRLTIIFELPALHQKGWRSLAISTRLILETDFQKKGAWYGLSELWECQ